MAEGERERSHPLQGSADEIELRRRGLLESEPEETAAAASEVTAAESASPDGGRRAASDPRTERPRDAATLIMLDDRDGDTRVLMGRRRDDQVFMPGKYVFPGGRVDPTDRIKDIASPLSDGEVANLLVDMKGQPNAARAQAIALAAVRETFEEAGLLIGAPLDRRPETPVESWQRFFAEGFAPALEPLAFFARAITPPGRPRRYDTRFFCTRATAIAHRVDTIDGELSGLHWLTLEEARRLDLPTITRAILEDLEDHLRTREDATATGAAPSVPYYYHRNGSFYRDLIRDGALVACRA